MVAISKNNISVNISKSKRNAYMKNRYNKINVTLYGFANKAYSEIPCGEEIKL